MIGRHHLRLFNISVPISLVGGEGVPEKPEIRMMPCHKKNPELGEKQVYYSSRVLIDQADARTFKEGEEVIFSTPLLK